MQQVRLGDMLLKAGLIQEHHLQAALVDVKRSGGRLGEALVRLGFVQERDLVEVLAEHLHLPAVLPGQLAHIPPAVLERVPGGLAHALCVVPVEVLEGGRAVAVATSEVLRGSQFEQLRVASRAWILLRLAGPTELRQALARHYGPAPSSAPGVAGRRGPGPNGAVRPVPTERGLQAMVELLIERGFFTEADLARKLGKG